MNIKFNAVFDLSSLYSIPQTDNVHWFFIVATSLETFRFIVSTHVLVPVELVGVSHRSTRSTITALDVANTPTNLGLWIC